MHVKSEQARIYQNCTPGAQQFPPLNQVYEEPRVIRQIVRTVRYLAGSLRIGNPIMQVNFEPP